MIDHTTQCFGLTVRDLAAIHGIFSAHPEVTEVLIFGSRATGTFKPGSDIDLAVMNDGVRNETLRKIVADFEDSSLPYFVDILLFPGLKNKELAEQITTNGKSIYLAAQPGIHHPVIATSG